MSHWHVEVLLTANGHQLKAVLCIPWEQLEIVEGVLVVKNEGMKQGPMFKAFGPSEWSKLERVEHD